MSVDVLGTATRTALVVDDDASIRNVLRTCLEVEGYGVVDAEDGFSCLALLGETRPDVILLDVMMPGMDGITVLRHIRAGDRAPDVPVVILTAATDYERRWAAKKAGADAYLTKPVEMDTLVAEIDRVLATAA